MSITPIDNPLPGERVIALSPETSEQATVTSLRRPNLFTGRTLTAPTLSGRQRWESSHLELRGQAFTPGVSRGLEVGHSLLPPILDGGGPRVRIVVNAGSGLAANGEDLVLVRQAEMDLLDVPVIVPESLQSEFKDGENLRSAIRVRLPPVGILLLQPVMVNVADFDPNDPCDLCPCGGVGQSAFDPVSYEDWRLSDAVRVVWFPWPEGDAWQPLPDPCPRQRNSLAYKIFRMENELKGGQLLPWEPFGVPIALVAVDENFIPRFIDRSAVARRGGHPRDSRLQGFLENPSRLGKNPRLPALWQARIEQLAEQVGQISSASPSSEAFAQSLGDAFAWLPPAGLLPPNVLDLSNLLKPSSAFFPSNFYLDVAPVPLEQLDTALREVSALVPFDFSLGERLRVLVPVPQSSYEPRLLKREDIGPEFQRTLEAFQFVRARQLGARQSLRVKIALLDSFTYALPVNVPAISDDPEALELESLSPWGPPPQGGGHRAALRSGLHQHFFDSATDTLNISPGNVLYAWVCLDPDNPPRTLMLQWNAQGSWDHRAYWGENLIDWGVDGTSSRKRIGDLPPKGYSLGQWFRLEVQAIDVELENTQVIGMAFALFDGQAGFGPSGVIRDDTVSPWITDQLPVGAVTRGDYPWQALSPNDLWAPFEPTFGFTVTPRPRLGGHRTQIRGGKHEYEFSNATETLTVAADQSLYVWVYLDPSNPPRTLMFQWFSGGSWEHRAFWGMNLIDLGAFDAVTPKPSRRQMGGLPPTGRWVRLEIPVAAVALVDQPISGINFALFDGRAVFGATGRLVDNIEIPWFADAMPNGASQPVDMKEYFPSQFLNEADLDTPFISAPGTVPAYPYAGTHAAFRNLADDNALAELSVRERAQLEVRGIEGFIAYLKSRADRADDLADYGFIKVQTDIYRFRQLMLDTVDASRLALSPVLANIAKSETATATQEKISGFLANLKFQSAATRPLVQSVAQPQAVSAPVMAMAAAPLAASTLMLRSMGSSVSSNVVSGVLAQQQPSTAAAFLSPLVVSPVIGVAQSPTFAMSTVASAKFNLAGIIGSSSEIKPVIKKPQITPFDIVDASPLAGNPTIRTVSIAQRLAAPKSTEARDYVTSTRHEGVYNLIRLADELTAEDGGVTPGLFFGIDVHGMEGEDFLAGNANRRRPLMDFIQRKANLSDLLKPPPVKTRNNIPALTDEAQHFSDSADLADNSVALLRQVEGRVKLYRNAIATCQRVLDTLRQDRQAAAARLDSIGEALAQARHDVGVTRSLMTEEQARIDGINARRAKVLAEEVKFLAYIRPRENDNLLASPSRNIDPGLIPAAVPTCLAQHDDVPDDLHDMLRVVREAPAAWFGEVPRLLNKLDRTDLLVKTVQSAQLRSQVLNIVTSKAQVFTATSMATKLAGAVANVYARQNLVVSQARSSAIRLDINALAGLSWQSVLNQAVQVVSLGDIIDGQHGRGIVSRQAAEHFERIGRICACLHAEFSAVLPSIRLDWAETLSEFDNPPPLRNLASLPRWGEIDYIDRRQMQSYADWLFDQIQAAEPRAETLMNDVVRMCLLLASHAPVDRIITGRLARPVTARPGVRIPLTVFEPAKLRVGMTALVYRGGEIVTRALVEDIGMGEVSARVVHTSAASVDLDDKVRVQFAATATVSASTRMSVFAVKR